MSEKESIRRKIARVVFIQAWRMYRRGSRWLCSFSTSLKVAWQIIRGKQFIMYTKVVGVSFNNTDGVSRQKILRRLLEIPKEPIAISLKREPENPVDRNAIQVVVAVTNKGIATLGYLNRNLASMIADELDSGKDTFAIFEDIIGTGFDTLGCRIAFVILDIKKESCR